VTSVSTARWVKDNASQDVESGNLPNRTAPFMDTYATGKTLGLHCLLNGAIPKGEADKYVGRGDLTTYFRGDTWIG